MSSTTPSQNKLNNMNHVQNKIQFLKSRSSPVFHFPRDKALSWWIPQKWSAFWLAKEVTCDKLRKYFDESCMKEIVKLIEVWSKRRQSSDGLPSRISLTEYLKQPQKTWFLSCVLPGTASSLVHPLCSQHYYWRISTWWDSGLLVCFWNAEIFLWQITHLLG